MKILIIEEDLSLSRFLANALGRENYEVQVWDGTEEAASDRDCDLILLDLSLPVQEGVAVLRQFRQQKPAAFIIVLTVRDRSDDPVRYLDAGADDFLSKPFAYGELSARIRALQRRDRNSSESLLEVGDLRLDRVGHRVQRAGRIVELTTKEFYLLEYLMLNAGKQVTRAAIIENVWKISLSPATTNVVDVYIAFLNNEKLQLAQQENTVGAADMTAVASQLVNTENSRSAALAAIGKMSQSSLFDYL